MSCHGPHLRAVSSFFPRPTGCRIGWLAYSTPAKASRVRFLNTNAAKSLHDSPCIAVGRRTHNAHRSMMLMYPRLSACPAAAGARIGALSSNSPSRRSYSSNVAASAKDLVEPRTAGSERPTPPDYLNEKERSIFDKLNKALDPSALQVEDISGGCGSMYAVAITAEKFQGLPVIKQHRLVNEVLGEDIKSWHGMQLRTKAP